MATQAKIEKVKELVGKIKDAKSIIFLNYQGISVNEDTELRKKAREEDVEYFVAKNRLFKLALKEAGVEESFDDELNGTTAFALGYGDVVTPAKVVFEFGIDKEFLNIKAGYIEGKKMLKEEIEVLAKLPSRDQLLSMVLSGMLSPVRKLAYGLVALKDQKEAE